MKDLCEATGLPKVVFHSLRNLSVSMKLTVTNGDIKAVQGDTGHSQSSMVVDVYSRTFDSRRIKMAKEVENELFGNNDEEPCESA